MPGRNSRAAQWRDHQSPWESPANLRLADETDDYKQGRRISSILGAEIGKNYYQRSKNLIGLS
jgi:hypothetical protein